jgi:hypothetical protein
MSFSSDCEEESSVFIERKEGSILMSRGHFYVPEDNLVYAPTDNADTELSGFLKIGFNGQSLCDNSAILAGMTSLYAPVCSIPICKLKCKFTAAELLQQACEEEQEKWRRENPLPPILSLTAEDFLPLRFHDGYLFGHEQQHGDDGLDEIAFVTNNVSSNKGGKIRTFEHTRGVISSVQKEIRGLSLSGTFEESGTSTQTCISFDPSVVVPQTADSCDTCSPCIDILSTLCEMFDLYDEDECNKSVQTNTSFSPKLEFVCSEPRIDNCMQTD